MTPTVRQSATTIVRPKVVTAIAGPVGRVVAVRSQVCLPAVGSSGGSNQSRLFLAASALSALRVVAINGDGKLIYADPNNPDHAFRVIGLLQSAVVMNAGVQALMRGFVIDSSWHWQLDKPIWLGANGTLTQNPTGTGFLLIVATVIDAQTLNFELQEVNLYG